MADTLPSITRPNGKTYRPRKLVTAAWEDDGYGSDQGVVVVFGTHDIEVARPLAENGVRHFQGCEYAVRPELVWWRDTIRYGERQWAWDREKGRAGVRFVASDDPEESPVAAAALGCGEQT